MKNNIIIDTNIIASANELADHLSSNDIEKSKIFVIDLLKNNKIVYSIDYEGELFDEYFKYATRKGQPGLGDALAKYIWDNQASTNICEQVKNGSHIPKYYYQIFKENEDLLEFDKSDLKFIAVRLNSKNSPVICNACDGDWNEKKELLIKHHINVFEVIN